MVDAAHECVQPSPGLARHRVENFRHRFPEIEGAERNIDVSRERPRHFREPALRCALHRLHLGKAQVRMNDAERDGQVLVRLGLDEGHEVLVPVNRHRPLEGSARNGEGRDALGRGRLVRQRRQKPTSAQDESAYGENDYQDGYAGKSAGHG